MPNIAYGQPVYHSPLNNILPVQAVAAEPVPAQTITNAVPAEIVYQPPRVVTAEQLGRDFLNLRQCEISAIFNQAHQENSNAYHLLQNAIFVQLNIMRYSRLAEDRMHAYKNLQKCFHMTQKDLKTQKQILLAQQLADYWRNLEPQMFAFLIDRERYQFNQEVEILPTSPWYPIYSGAWRQQYPRVYEPAYTIIHHHHYDPYGYYYRTDLLDQLILLNLYSSLLTPHYHSGWGCIGGVCGSGTSSHSQSSDDAGQALAALVAVVIIFSLLVVTGLAAYYAGKKLSSSIASMHEGEKVAGGAIRLTGAAIGTAAGLAVAIIFSSIIALSILTLITAFPPAAAVVALGIAFAVAFTSFGAFLGTLIGKYVAQGISHASHGNTHWNAWEIKNTSDERYLRDNGFDINACEDALKNIKDKKIASADKMKLRNLIKSGSIANWNSVTLFKAENIQREAAPEQDNDKGFYPRVIMTPSCPA